MTSDELFAAAQQKCGSNQSVEIYAAMLQILAEENGEDLEPHRLNIDTRYLSACRGPSTGMDWAVLAVSEKLRKARAKRDLVMFLAVGLELEETIK